MLDRTSRPERVVGLVFALAGLLILPPPPLFSLWEESDLVLAGLGEALGRLP